MIGAGKVAIVAFLAISSELAAHWSTPGVRHP
jgi:hypothetical protein